MRRQKQTPLDLIPIMGLMTLLIPMLLMSQGTGVALATVDTDLPSCCSGGHDPKAPDYVTPSLMLTLDHVVVRAGEDEGRFEIDDMEGLGQHLEGLKGTLVHNGNAIIVPESGVRYQKLIEVMDTVRPHFPSSTLAGGVL